MSMYAHDEGSISPSRLLTGAGISILLTACGTPLAPPVETDTADTGTVDSGGQDSAEDSGPVETDEDGDFLFGDRTLDFEISLDDADIAALTAEPYEEVRADFTFQGQTWEVGLRLKGSRSFRGLDEKSAFKVDFQEWDAAGRFYGFKRLTLNNMIQDGGMSSEHVSYRLHGLVGHPAPRHGYARVTVNGTWYGLYGVVEGVDDDFLERHFPGDDEGNLYEGGYGGDFQEGCAPLFEQKEGVDTSLADLEAVIDDVEASSPATFPDVLARYFDVDALMGVWAVELVSSNADAYTTLGNNFFAYHAPSGGWTMIPWGTDQAFTGEEPVIGALYGELAERCQDSPACLERLEERVRDVVSVWEQADLASWVDAETARIEDDCRADPRSEWGDYGCRDALAALRDWVRARPDAVRSELGG
jgi:hypothetical protein